MSDTTAGVPDWTHELAQQLDWHWRRQLRPRLEGLTDEEYFWEPVPDCWSLRTREESRTPMAAGGGRLLLDYVHPAPEPPPFTTIAWRLNHVLMAVLGRRNAAHFGSRPVDPSSFVYPETATEALAQLDAQYAHWIAGVRALTPAQLATAVGDREPFPDLPMAALVLHINREVIHHGAEIALLRDLYLHQPAPGAGDSPGPTARP